jgi:hypothetical protein
MKISPFTVRGVKVLLTASAVLMGACLSSSATVSITETYLGDLSTMPGSATDFTLLGKSTQFPTVPSYGGAEDEPTILDDFTVAAGSNAGHLYSGNGNYSVINAPAGSGYTNVTSGIIFNNGASAPNLVSFTLGTPGSTFNFSDFNVYVMYGNAHDGYEIDSSIDLTLLPPAPDLTPLASASPPVIDTNTNFGKATYEEFNITGASAGDVLEIGAESWGYLGGVSFEVPEPRTYLLIGLGMAALLVTRRSLKRS